MIKLVLKGVGTYIPGVAGTLAKGTGETNSARYYYSVWLRHLVMAHRNGLCRTPPRTILEFGPGDSLGVGLAALLSGAEKYYGLDVVRHISIQRNLAVFDELVALFRNEYDIPGEMEFPRIRPVLDSYKFPSHILTKGNLAVLLGGEKIEAIKRSIRAMNEPESMVSYVTGSLVSETIPQQSIDMVLSQAVLQYVEPLLHTYRLMNLWLRSEGFMSHQINFGCHGLAKEWNGHWSYSDLQWNLIRGKRMSFITRTPHSAHIRLLEEASFRIVCDLKMRGAAASSKPRLAPRFAALSLEDQTTEAAFVQAVKRNSIETGGG